MIPVQKRPEPKDFDLKVRQPGVTFLAKTAKPTIKDWEKHRYWKKVLADMYDSYAGICSYSGERISRPGSIDHFIPKWRSPNLAYEWDNYRLSSPKLNNYKADKEGIADPFVINYGWFVLDFPSCLIKPGPGLSTFEEQLVHQTINILKLNAYDDFVQNRCNILVFYSCGDVSFNFLKNQYPFIASELERQDLVEKVKEMFKSSN